METGWAMRVSWKNRTGFIRGVGSLAFAALVGACAWFGIGWGAGVNASAKADSSTPHKVFRMHRPGLRVRLEVRGGEIFPTRVWALSRCSSGFEGSGGLFLEEPGQGLPIRPDGRFEYEFSSDEIFFHTRLAGRVSRTKITGFFLRWHFDDRDLCGTGRPGHRALHFVAR